MALSASGATAVAQTIAIQAETVIPVSGPAIKNGVVVVRDGKIAAVGKGIPVPNGARVLRASVVMPGLVDAHTYLACRNETDEPVDAVTPDLRACDAFDPQSPELRKAVAAGITLAGIAPGNGNVVGGQMAAVRLGTKPQVLSGYAAQKLSISLDATNAQRNPTSRAGVVSLCRAALGGARAGGTASSTRQTGLLVGDFPTSLSERSRSLQPVVGGKVPVFIHAPLAADVEAAMLVSQEFNLRPVLLHAADASRVGGVKATVVLGPLKLDDKDRALENPGRLAKSGAKVAFCTDGPFSDPGSLRLTAHLAVKSGMSPEAAVRGITLSGAEALGLAARTGSITVGKDADILLLSGDPLDLTSRVQAVLSGGKVVYETGNR